ncbi:MAG: hypothetical protein K8I60_08590, partial [Anaerolineae bacterium]|nr:hypothetical protein [Anaerolineae bacterium]
MKETQAIIERISRVNNGFQRLHLAMDDSLSQIKPGQSLLARPAESWNPYLREHWWPVEVNSGSMVVERPIENRYEPGQIVTLLGMIGQPYRYRRTLRNVLLLAYDTPPIPLLLSIGWLLANKISVTMVLLGTATQYDTAHLPPEVEIVKGGVDFSWPDRVMTVGWADQVFVTVAPDDEWGRFGKIWALFSELRAEIPSNYLFGIFQPVLPCGVGACQACLISL